MSGGRGVQACLGPGDIRSIRLLAGAERRPASGSLIRGALTRGLKLAGAEGPCKPVPSVSNGLVGAASGGADRDMDPLGATPHWRRRRRRQQYIDGGLC